MKHINIKFIQMEKLMLLLSIIIFGPNIGQAQNSRIKSKLMIEYRYKTIFPNGNKGDYSIYFIVDSTKSILYNRKTFYQFSFSLDSTEVSGYISYNKLAKKLYFIEKNFKNKNPYCNAKIIQSAFVFDNAKTNNLCSFGVLGSNISLISRRLMENPNFNYEIEIINKSPVPSERMIIKEMFFKEDFYPALIVIDDPILEKKAFLKAVSR